MELSEISEAILRILRREGADTTMILGSRLGAIVREEHEDLLRAAMEQHGVRFVQLVQRVPDVVVLRNAGTGVDVLIGLEGALPPPRAGEPRSLRPDVYAAFTRYGDRYSYDPGKDMFHEGPPSEDGVECPEVLPEDLAEVRKEFASTLGEPGRSELLATLDGREGLLARFREAITRMHLTKDWEHFRYEVLSAKVREWATTQGLPIQPTWFFRSESARETLPGPKLLLRDLADSMTVEEARAIRIPISTVERYLSRRSQGRSI
ncbi:MAG: hypothetical protein OXU67_14140 [Chloroflexota bacterium]|nr:hypothetical protein [Chloroflexota bacterium]